MFARIVIAASLTTTFATSARAESIRFVDRDPKVDALAGAALVQLGAKSTEAAAVRYDALGRTWVSALVAEEAEVLALQRAAADAQTPFVVERVELETGALVHHVALGVTLVYPAQAPDGSVYNLHNRTGSSTGGGAGESTPPEDDSDSGGSTGDSSGDEETCVTVIGVTLCI